MIWLATFVATILLNLDIGLAASVVFALLTVIYRIQLPHYSILAQVPETHVYKDATQYKQVKEIPGVKIFHSSTTVYYVNADLYAEALKEKIGVDVDKLIEKKTAIEHQKTQQRRMEKKAQKEGTEKENGCICLKVVKHAMADEECQNGRIQTAPEEPTLESPGPTEPDLHSLILDISSVSFLDTVSLKVFKKVFRDFHEIGVEVYLTGCQATVIHQMDIGGFFSSSITNAQLFASVHDAVTHILKNQDISKMQVAKDPLWTRL